MQSVEFLGDIVDTFLERKGKEMQRKGSFQLGLLHVYDVLWVLRGPSILALPIVFLLRSIHLFIPWCVCSQ
jgi:hypothetical protein